MTTVSRRSFLVTSGVGAAGAVTLLGTKLAFAAPGTPNTGDTLVVIYLDGGADGLSMAPPYAYDSYRKLRPTLAVAAPGAKDGALPLTSANKNAAFPTGIDGVVGLHPALKPIHDTLWAQGKLAVIPAIGVPASETPSRSHFVAGRYVKAGSTSSSVGGGWLGRMVNVQASGGAIPAVNTDDNQLLAGSSTVHVPFLSSFGLAGFADSGLTKEALQTMFGGSDSVSQEGRKFLNAVDLIDEAKALPETTYPETSLGKKLREVSRMIKANIGLQAVSITNKGWDHHGGHGPTSGGKFTTSATELAEALRVFADDTNGLQEITVVVITEFGRSIEENGSSGTDHGRAGTFLVMGAGIQGGVYGDDYPSEIKHDPTFGDLSVLTDYRKPLTEVIRERAGVTNLGVVFPGYVEAGNLGLSR